MDHEHDCLPPMEHTGSWVLSEKAVQSIEKAVQSIVEALQRIIPVVNSINEAFVQLREIGLSSRNHRKVKRWDEKNRRRRLKGLPEQPCPYQNRLLQIASANCGKKENDQSRDDEKAVKWND